MKEIKIDFVNGFSFAIFLQNLELLAWLSYFPTSCPNSMCIEAFALFPVVVALPSSIFPRISLSILYSTNYSQHGLPNQLNSLTER